MGVGRWWLVGWFVGTCPVTKGCTCNTPGGGGGLMTTFGDLGNYVNGFTCSPQEI